MTKLAREIITIIVDEYGSNDFLKRVSDPFWFQALGCVLGYDWHSSGVTTVLTGVLKNAVIPEEHGFVVCGGKGNASRKTPSEIEASARLFGLSQDRTQRLCYASRMSAKVDNAAIQAGYQLYHHAFFLTEHAEWAVVQQGMSLQDRTARRYHWLSEFARDFVVEPHSAIVGDVRREIALDMTARESEACRKASVDIVKEPPERTIRLLTSMKEEKAGQTLMCNWLPQTLDCPAEAGIFNVLSMPRNVRWKVLRDIYEFQPKNYEELLALRGVGPATVRGLALVAELIFGENPCCNDPVKYSFAYGGKDGVPFPVDRKAMDQSIQILRQAAQEARVGENERIQSLKRLTAFVPHSNVA